MSFKDEYAPTDFAAMGLPIDRGQNAFTAARKPSPGLEVEYAQKSYYWRKKAGVTGTRQNPDRHWRNSELADLPTQTGSFNTQIPSQTDVDRTASIARIK